MSGLRFSLVAMVMLAVLASLAAGDANHLTIKVFQYSPEYRTQMLAMAEEYHKAFPDQTLSFEISQTQYPQLLNSRIVSGNVPDVFMINSKDQLERYMPILADLTDEAFVKELHPSALGNWSVNGHLYGYPLWFQTYGIIYNKKLFRSLGINKLPGSMDDLIALCRQLRNAGVTPFGSAYKEWWIFKHIMERFMAVQGDYQGLADRISKGALGFADLKYSGAFLDFIDLSMANSQPNALGTDFNGQVSLFAQGKVAMIHQGDWAEGLILAADPKAEPGFFPLPVDKDLSLMSDSSLAWVVSRNSPRKAAVMQWLNWLSTSAYGVNFVSRVVNAQSTLIKASPSSGQLLADASRAIQAGRTLPWVERYWPNGFDVQFGMLMQRYLVKDLDRAGLWAATTRLWQDCMKAPKSQ